MLNAHCLFLMIMFFLFVASPSQAEICINLEAVKAIESSNNPLAFNAKTRCYGLYQISGVCLRDYNQLNSANYKPKDLFNPALNKKISSWYFKRIERMLKFFKIPVTIVSVLASYNWGIGNVVRWYGEGAKYKSLPKMTRNYIARYKALTAFGKRRHAPL